MRVLRKLVIAQAIVLAPVIAVAACSSPSPGDSSGGGSTHSGGTMNIGVIYPFTGANADEGGIGMAGCLAGIAEVNAAGGVLGKTFACKPFDTKGDPADATTAADQMMASASPVMVIGSSDDAVTTSPIVTAGRVVNFATIGDPHFDHQTNAYFYRLTPSDALQGIALGYWAISHGYTHAAAVFSSDLGAQTSVPPLLQEVAKLGGKLAGSVTLAPGQTSYRTEITKIIAMHPDALVSEMDPQSSTTFLTEYMQLAGSLPPVLGTQRTSNNDWIQAVLGGIGQADYTKYVKAVVPYVGLSGPGYDLYKHWLLTLGGTVQDPAQYVGQTYAISDYDAVNITALAMAGANSTDPSVYNGFVTKVTAPGGVIVHGYADGLKALKAGKRIQYVGASGPLVFDANHSAEREFSYDTFDAATKSMTPASIISGSQLAG
jgi:ABC-type branched-subunit amino acid transport system substrate-binding protein